MSVLEILFTLQGSIQVLKDLSEFLTEENMAQQRLLLVVLTHGTLGKPSTEHIPKQDSLVVPLLVL